MALTVVAHSFNRDEGQPDENAILLSERNRIGILGRLHSVGVHISINGGQLNGMQWRLCPREPWNHLVFDAPSPF